MLRLLSQQTVRTQRDPRILCSQTISRLAPHGHSLPPLPVSEVCLSAFLRPVYRARYVLLKLTTRTMLHRCRARALHPRTQGLQTSSRRTYLHILRSSYALKYLLLPHLTAKRRSHRRSQTLLTSAAPAAPHSPSRPRSRTCSL